MEIALGRTWFDALGGIGLLRTSGARGRTPAALVALALALSLSAPVLDASGARETGPLVSVIVRSLPRALGASQRAVEGLGGEVGRRIDIIDGFVAELPMYGIGALEKSAGVHSVTLNRRVELFSTVDGYDAVTDPGSMYTTSNVIKAPVYWKAGYTGKGIDVAVIDTGVAPVEGLSAPGKVVNGADLSFSSQADNLRYNDGFGHGTFMAGIIAGRDTKLTTPSQYAINKDGYVGVAPDARIVNVKVGDETGATDVSQVIAAIDWVVEHRKDPGMNIRVLNLSFGTDGTQDYRIDPLTYAAEIAWRKGIFVVAAAGNRGYGSAKLNNPAYDPFVLAVGASDTNGTMPKSDDSIPTFSSSGDGTRNPDLVAPGKSIQGLRVPNSYIDVHHPEGRINGRFFRGSGTSQAAAAVSGAAALVLQQRPHITPDQLKKLLTSTAEVLPRANATAQGAGAVELERARGAPTPDYTQKWAKAAGTGSLEAARGSAHLDDDGVLLQGEMDIFGAPWVASSWASAAAAETSWSGGYWRGYAWTGDGWTGTSWAGKTWSGKTWTGKTWAGKAWASVLWSGNTWSGETWTTDSWTGKTWTGAAWSGKTWTDEQWSSSQWGARAS